MKLPIRTAFLATAATLLAAVFVWKTVWPAWNVLHTDFPNYYVAARATLDGVPLVDLYDWPTFNRLIRESGIEHQLGAFAPQPPPALFPFLPLARFEPLTAKRLWLIVNLALLPPIGWMLRLSAKLRFDQLIWLAVAGYGALHTNFLYGQYYILLLFLITLSWLLLARRPALGGVMVGIVAALKLWGAPFLLYFARMRNWGALGGMMSTTVVFGVSSVLVLGVSGNWFFVDAILPRLADGQLIDPYHPAFDSFTVRCDRLSFPSRRSTRGRGSRRPPPSFFYGGCSPTESSA